MDSPSKVPATGTKLLVTELQDTRGFMLLIQAWTALGTMSLGNLGAGISDR